MEGRCLPCATAPNAIRWSQFTPVVVCVDNLFTSVWTTCLQMYTLSDVGRASDDRYDGIPYQDILIQSVRWSDAVAQHMASRSMRYGRPQLDILDPGWATEAASDPFRLVGDGRSHDGDTIRVVGWSTAAPGRQSGSGRLL